MKIKKHFFLILKREIREMMNKLMKTWGIGMFTYGFVREWNGMFHKHQKEEYLSRFMFSYLNGLYYITPIGLVKLYHTYQRFEDNNKDNSIYYEILGTNYEKFL